MSPKSSGGTPPALGRLAMVAAIAAGFATAAHATNYVESTFPGGDYSSDNLNPTAITLTPGSNIISGTTGAFDSDYLTFTIPTGETLATIEVEDGSQAPDRIFFGIADGGSVVVDPSFTSAAGLIGWTLFSNAQDGDNVLPALGLAAPPNFPAVPGATGFTPPLGPGQYTVWIVDGDGAAGTAPYALNFGVSAPEPGAWALLIVGVGGIGVALRTRRQGLSSRAGLASA